MRRCTSIVIILIASGCKTSSDRAPQTWNTNGGKLLTAIATGFANGVASANPPSSFDNDETEDESIQPKFNQTAFDTPSLPTISSSPILHNQAANPPALLNANSFHPDSLSNHYGAGSPYKADGLMNPYSQFGSKYSNTSWTNPYATDAPKIYDSGGKYHGRLSTNQFDPDSTSNPHGQYGSRFSPDSVNNPFGAGNPYSAKPMYVVPNQTGG